MTINKVIEESLRLCPDTFPDSIKTRWLSELDGKILREVMHRDDFTPYKFPRDGEKELVVKEPYDNIYELYLTAMSHFYSGEMDLYSASAILFDGAYAEFKKNYIRNNMPPVAAFVIKG